MTAIDTHQSISTELVGRPVAVGDGTATVELETTTAMRADETGLIHGGFVYGAADYAAMLAVNEPTVVLAGSSVTYPAPTRAGDLVTATASVTATDGRRRTVECTAAVEDETTVLEGTFDCTVPDRHVLEPG